MARCECAQCNERFTGVSAFDEHLKGGGLVHVHPSRITRLRQRPDGVWGFDRKFDPEALSQFRRSSQTA